MIEQVSNKTIETYRINIYNELPDVINGNICDIQTPFNTIYQEIIDVVNSSEKLIKMLLSNAIVENQKYYIINPTMLQFEYKTTNDDHLFENILYDGLIQEFGLFLTNKEELIKNYLRENYNKDKIKLVIKNNVTCYEIDFN